MARRAAAERNLAATSIVVPRDAEEEEGEHAEESTSPATDSWLRDFAAGLPSAEDQPPAQPDSIGRAVDAARAWDPGAEDAFRAALTELMDSGKARALAYGWDRLGAYFIDRAKPEPALLSYELSRELSERAGDEDAASQALYGECYALADLGETRAQLACLAVLERRGASGLLPTASDALAGQRLTRAQRWRLDRFVARDDRCREAIAAAIKGARRRVPDFPHRFLAGDTRFDGPDEVFALVREPERDRTYRDEGALGQAQRYRRRLVTRLAVPSIPLILAAALLGTRAVTLSWRVMVFALVPALAVYVWAWFVSVRSIWLWVRASRVDLEMRERLGALRRTESTHHTAYSILRRFAEKREPFGLFLRSFEPEAVEFVTPEGVVPLQASKTEDRYVVTHLSGRPSRVEEYLAAKVAPRVPMIAVTNPAAVTTGSGLLPRLELGNDSWARAVRLLISAARFIVMDSSVLAPGVVEELDLVRNREREADSVIVLPSSERAREIQEGRELVGLGFQVAVGPSAPLSTGEADALAGFRRVVDEETLLGSDPAALPAFDGLFE